MAINRLSILHVYKDYFPPVKGGIEYHINLLSNALKDSGHDVHVLVANTRNSCQVVRSNGIEVVKAPQWGRFASSPLTLSFGIYLKRLGKHADIIHFHHPNPTAEFSYLFSGLKNKMIVTYHSDIIRQDKLGKLYSPFRKRFLHACDKIIVTSPNYLQTSNVLKQFKHKCAIIPLGIDINRFNSSGDLSRIESIRKKNGKLPIVLFVGRFRYYKGLHLLIHAMKDIEAKLLLIGTGSEDRELRRLAAVEGLGDKIRFLGELSNEAVIAYYKACDMFVLPSHLRSEAFGLVQLEAMCCGKPVISTEIGSGTSFVNVDQQTGITVKPNDVEALRSAIQFLIDHPDKRKTWGERGRRRVKQLFTKDKMVERTLALYEAVVGREVA